MDRGDQKRATRRGQAAVGLTAALVLGGCALTRPSPGAPVTAGEVYVAMGSSFAAGPGVSTAADTPPNRCARSADNYAHLLARRRSMTLIDVSCSGATTAALLEGWAGLPPQIDAVGPGTRLVTITIGGNDLGYIGGLSGAACRQRAAREATGTSRCASIKLPSDESLARLEERLIKIGQAVSARAPRARVIFVDYLTVLPVGAPCVKTPVSAEAADQARQTAARLAATTARAAKKSGAELVAASRLSRGHDACARTPWTLGAPQGGEPFAGAPFHPNLAGMQAIAEALDRRLK